MTVSGSVPALTNANRRVSDGPIFTSPASATWCSTCNGSVGAASLVTPECGVVLPDSEDAAALARALRSLVEDAPLRERMGRKAREVAQAHGWAQMAEAYFRLYERLAETPLGSRSGTQ